MGGLGFKDLMEFNLALLAKTVSRASQNPYTLWVRILKGLYLPRCNFLPAKKGACTSWYWSSIVEGKEVLKNGLVDLTNWRWKIY